MNQRQWQFSTIIQNTGLFCLFNPRNVRRKCGRATDGVEGAKEVFGADEAYPIAELDEKLPQYLEKSEFTTI